MTDPSPRLREIQEREAAADYVPGRSNSLREDIQWLLAELARLTQELKILERDYDKIDLERRMHLGHLEGAEIERDEARRERDDALIALEKYAMHERDCEAYQTFNPCTCGLAAYLAASTTTEADPV